MRERDLTFSDVAMIAGTRVALGAGIGFLLSGRLSKAQRTAAGWALFAVGAFTSIPLVMKVLASRSVSRDSVGPTVETNVPL